MFKSWSFRVTSEMSPSARLIGYYIDSNERVVADSILLRIDDKLPTEVTRKGYGEIRARGDFFNICERVFFLSGELWDDCLYLDFSDDLEQQSSQKFCIEREMNIWYIVIRYLSFLPPWAANHYTHFCENCHFLTSRFNRDPRFPIPSPYTYTAYTPNTYTMLIAFCQH